MRYGGDEGQDLELVAEMHGLSPEDVIRLHTGAEYRVYMIGFAPGFAYLGGLPEALHTSRRVDPRERVPAGSIAVGGKQAAVFPPMELPSGWHMLGRTPVKTYDPARPEPFLLAAGDRVVFDPISEGNSYPSAPWRMRGKRLREWRWSMGEHLAVIDPGMQSTLQDFGRYGFQRYGISAAGAIDVLSMQIANALVGNARDEAVIELTLSGGTYRVEADHCRMAMAGPPCPSRSTEPPRISIARTI